MINGPRELVTRVRMSNAERRMLDALADSMGVTISDWLRLHVRGEFAKLPPPPKRAR